MGGADEGIGTKSCVGGMDEGPGGVCCPRGPVWKCSLFLSNCVPAGGCLSALHSNAVQTTWHVVLATWHTPLLTAALQDKKGSTNKCHTSEVYTKHLICKSHFCSLGEHKLVML